MDTKLPLPKADILWALVLADTPGKVAILELETDTTQAEAVTYFLEETCWSGAFPHFAGGAGSSAMRRTALIEAYRRENPEPVK